MRLHTHTHTHTHTQTHVCVCVCVCVITAILHLSELTGKPSHSDMQIIRIIGFFFENRVHWQFEVFLLLSAACTCV